MSHPSLALALALLCPLSFGCNKSGGSAVTAPVTPPPAPAPGCAAGPQLQELPARCYLPSDSDATTGVAVGDLDGDHDLDIVVVSRDAVTARLYFNDGIGRFADATFGRLSTPAMLPGAVALSDLDGDTDLDLVIGGGTGPDVLFANDGNGVFTNVTDGRLPPSTSGASAIVTADVDGDGDLDLVMASELGRNRLLANDGNGAFTDVTSTQLPGGTRGSYAIAAGDVDGDGDFDLVVGNYRQNELYLNDGDGAFSDATAGRLPVDSDFTLAVTLLDVDADGDLDILAGNVVQQVIGFFFGPNRLYLNDGTGSFAEAPGQLPGDSDDTYSLATGDVDGDGDPDVVLGNGAENRLYVNDGNGRFKNIAEPALTGDHSNTRGVVLADLDGNGQLDVLAANLDERNRLYLGRGTGTFVAVSSTRMPEYESETAAVATGDVNGDGHLDVIWTGERSRLLVNDGTGVLEDVTATQLPIGGGNTIVAGDVDGDGDVDLILGTSRENALLDNDGSGWFTNRTPGRLPLDSDETLALALNDVDADGDLDLIAANGTNGSGQRQNRIYLNSRGKFTDVTATHLPFDHDVTQALALGDLDGDGDIDMMLGNADGIRMYSNRGAGDFADASAGLPALTDDVLSLALGDIDGDGDLDAAVGTQVRQPLRLLLNDGGGIFSDVSQNLPQDSPGTSALAFADIDLDGDADLVIGNNTEFSSTLATGSIGAASTRVYLNDGRGAFADGADQRVSPLTDITNALALGDVDRDGDLDVILGNRRSNRLLFNMHRHINAPFFAETTRPYVIELRAKPGYAASSHTATPFISFATAPNPVPVPGIGVFFLDLTRIIQLPNVTIPRDAGLATMSLTLPPGLAALSPPLCTQVLIAADGNPADAHLTGYTCDSFVR